MEIPATGAANELAITYRFVESGPVDNRARYKIWEEHEHMNDKLKAAFGAAGITIALTSQGGVLLDDGIFTAQDMFDFYQNQSSGPVADYPYLVVGALAYRNGLGQIEWDTPGGSPNMAFSPGTPMSAKYSFIFRGALLGGDWLYPYTVIHELGHVRAQLRHPSEFEDEHIDKTKSWQFASCVMWQLKDLPETSEGQLNPSLEKIRAHMGFCGWSQEPSVDPTTCVQFLEASNEKSSNAGLQSGRTSQLSQNR